MSLTGGEKYYEFVKNDIQKNTYSKITSPYHIFLYDCNIGVHLNHDSDRPYFNWIPQCFWKLCETKYGLTEKELKVVWYEWYWDYVINLYISKREERRRR
jgi:hypothetical protein